MMLSTTVRMLSEACNFGYNLTEVIPIIISVLQDVNYGCVDAIFVI